MSNAVADRIAELKSAQTVVDAIRLALEAGATADASLALIQTIIEEAPATDPDDTLSVKLLINAMLQLGGSVTVPE